MATTIEQLRTKTTISVSQAAEVLGIGLSLAYAQAANGRIGEVRVIRIGRRVVVPTRDLLRVLGDVEA